MANEIELNGLADMDSLPNDWKISLIDPEPSKAAQNITVARFCESLTSKIPVATSESNGLLNAGDKSLIDGRLATVVPSLDGDSWVKVLSVPKDKEGFFSALTSGNRYIDMNPISELFNFQIYGGAYMIKTSILSHGATFDSRWRYTDNGSTIDIYLIAGVWLNNPMIVLANDFGLVNEAVLIPSNSKKPIITNITSSVSLMKNDLTETISSPVLESRQVGGTCLHIHLYQILLHTYRGKREKMVQYQLNLNYQENSMSGRLTRSERQYSNYKQKTRDLNKSSISLTIARYNKCNLPRAGPPRLIK